VDRYLEALIHRNARFRFHGREFGFALSTALFSSAGVDAGTQTLLRCLAEVGPPAGLVHDVGCGTGTLGIVVAAHTGSRLLGTDRDALACWFTGRNAAANRVECQTETSLGFSDRTGGSRDKALLCVCNVPAKAGAPVIDALVLAMLGPTESERHVGLVVVTPLAERLKRLVSDSGSDLVAARESKGHFAIVARPASGPTTRKGEEAEELPAAYVRGSSRFEGPNGNYDIDAAFNLPEFDSLGYDSNLLFNSFTRFPPGGNVCCWGVGQGHVPIAISIASPRASITVMDRDLLAIRTTVHNLRRRGYTMARSIPAPCIGCAAADLPAASVDWLVVRSSPEPGSLWAEEIIHASEHLLRPGGHLAIASRSSSVHHLQAPSRPVLSPVDSLRDRGYRVDILRRRH